MFRWIGGLIDRLFAVAGALIFSQMPLFMQHYQQHLSGHVNELQIQVQGMRNAAAMTGKTLQQYVIKFLNSGDIDFNNQGELMNEMIHRYNSLSEGYHALQEASFYSKPFVFLKYLDKNIAQSTWNSFEVGLSFNVEGIAYAIIGIGFGLLMYRLVLKVVSLFLRLRPGLPLSK
jgi:hypothetical protein